MLYELIFISSFIVFFFGIFIIVAMISNQVFSKILDDVNNLAGRSEKESVSVRDLSVKYVLIKRIIDFSFSFVSLFLSAPIIAFIVVAIKLDSKGPALYKTQRIGKNGKLFFAYKFRTMKIIEELSENNHLSSFRDPRITRVGLFLRKTALDELPNILNVLLGNMSIVGTTIAREFEYENIPKNYKEIIRKYKPGLTSLWVVSRDRQMYSYKRRLLYDLYYIENYSLKLDLSIIYKTFILSLGETASS